MINSSRSNLVNMSSLTPNEWLVLCCVNSNPHLFHSEQLCRRLSVLKILLSADLHEVVDYISLTQWRLRRQRSLPVYPLFRFPEHHNVQGQRMNVTLQILDLPKDSSH
jgi:hypothetical protein